MKKKLLRTSTVAMSLDLLLKGQLRFLNHHYEVVAVSGSDKHLKTVLEREGVATRSVVMQRAIAPLHDLISLFKLYSLFRKEKPLIVHSITPKAGLLSMMAAYFAGVPIRMHTFTGLVFPYKTGIMQQLLRYMDQLLCRFATHVYPEGEGVKSDLLAYKVTTKPLQVLANGNVNGVDLEYFHPKAIAETQKQDLKNNLCIAETDFVFVFVGRLVSDKGINELITAFEALLAVNPNVKLILVGPYEPELDPLSPVTLEKIENLNAIISVGFQEDIRPFLAVADAFVFPSHREGFPNVVLQAGAMGLPCIVTDICGCNEIILPNENGLLIPVNNKNAIFEAMQKFISEPELFAQMKSKACDLIATRYRQELVWQSLLAEYKKLENEYVQKNR